MKTISIVGGGKVGRTLGRLWAQTPYYSVESIYSRRRSTAIEAAKFIGSGTVVDSIQGIANSDIILITVVDTEIENICSQLYKLEKFCPGNFVIHCSGSIPSTVLKLAHQSGSYVGSIHPVKSFVDPMSCLASFPGTYCGIEGNQESIDVMHNMVESIKGIPFLVKSDQKTIYHAAAVFCCNYLPALISVGLDAYEKAGVDRALAQKIINPIIRETIDNIIQRGPVASLSGPIARGDAMVIGRQMIALKDWNVDNQQIYALLGEVAIKLAHSRNNVPEAVLTEIKEIFSKK